MRRFWCILLSVSLIFCFTVPAFASPWSSTEVTIVTNGVQSIDTKLSNIYTALQVIYNYISNNGSGIREGIYSLYLNSNTANDRLQYLLNVGYTISGYLEPLAGDGKNIAQQLLDIRQNQLSIGGQVGDVSSKLLTTNQSLSSIDTNISSINSDLGTILARVNNEFAQWSSKALTFVGLSTDGVNYSKVNTNGDIIYAKANVNFTQDTAFNNRDTIIKITMPIVPNFVDYVEVIIPEFNNVNVELFLYDINYSSTTFYLRLNNSVTISSFVFVFHMLPGSSTQQRIRYDSSGNYNCQFLTNQYTRFYDVLADLYTLKNSQLIQEQTDAIRSLANEFNGTNGIIQDDSDTTIIVDFDADTGEDVSDFITTVKNFFDTGVSIGELTIALNQFSNMPWFTDLNTYNTVNDQGAYYKDLY